VCLDKKEQNFVDYAKQIVVYLAGTPAGSKVVEFLQLQITPKAMVQEKDKRQSYVIPQEASSLPYLADLAAILPGGNKQVSCLLSPIPAIADRPLAGIFLRAAMSCVAC
jgi:hypothetical protein